MLYENELVQPSKRRQVGLLVFKTHDKRAVLQWEKYRVRLASAFAHSTVHGMHYVFDGGQRQWQRYFWLLTVIATAFSCVMAYSILSQRHNEQQLITIVDSTQLPVYNVDFPAVAVCPWNHINWIRAHTAAKRFLSKNRDASVDGIFHDLLVAMELLTFGNFDDLSILSTRNLSAINSQLSLRELASFMAYRCDEIFDNGSCFFDETNYDCCKLFLPERTEIGHCLVFNSLLSDGSRKNLVTEKIYPHKLSTAGETSGLMFTLTHNRNYVRPGSNIPFAVNILIKEPLQRSETLSYHLYPNTENFITIRPEILETAKQTYTVPPLKRHCFFDNESPVFAGLTLPYSRQNCIALCQQQNLNQICNCTMPMFFPNLPGSRECQVSDFYCVYSNRDVFSYIKQPQQDRYIKDPRRGMYCFCPNNCYSVTYALSLNSRLMANNVNTTTIKADIHFGQRLITKYMTKLKYTSLDLLANFGGVLGLFVGASALSFAELAYILTKLIWLLLIDLKAYFMQKLQTKRQMKK